MKRNHNISFIMSAVRKQATSIRRAVYAMFLNALILLVPTGCIEPPLHLPGNEVLIEMPIVQTDLEVLWDVDADWQTRWYYGWDETDTRLWGPIAYPTPTNYEVRRYYLGNTPRVPHTEVDAFTIWKNSFRKYYSFGYYDMLLWSNIDSEDQTQVVIINEKNLDEVIGTTSGTRGMMQVKATNAQANSVITGLFNQPEIYYSAYEQDIFISRNFEDYDYFDEKENVWVKKINVTLTPLVYIYLVQIVIYNNNGRVTGVNGNNAIAGMSSSTSLNTGHTSNSPCMVYFQSRMKRNIDVNGRNADIIGGKFTTYGLCDLAPYSRGSSPIYRGSRTDMPNTLYFDLTFKNGKEKTYEVDITEQCRRQCHGGIITIELDADDIPIPEDGDPASGSLFVPTVEDYDEVVWDIEI